MVRTGRRSASKILVILIIAFILFGFTPISRALLRTTDGSFAMTPYSSLALKTPSNGVKAIRSGEAVPVQLTNHTGHEKTYHWNATQGGSLISLGETTLRNGEATTILVPSRGAAAGRMQISLTNTHIFVTIPILKS
jgi:hypothetical protein